MAHLAKFHQLAAPGPGQRLHALERLTGSFALAATMLGNQSGSFGTGSQPCARNSSIVGLPLGSGVSRSTGAARSAP